MTTSPDDSRPAGISVYVLPDVLRPRVDALLASLGLTVVAAPPVVRDATRDNPTYLALPPDEVPRETVDFDLGGVPDEDGPLRFVRSERLDTPRD